MAKISEQITNEFKERIYKQFALGYSLARTTVFAAQGALLPWIDFISTGERRASPKDYPEHLKQAIPKIHQLLQKDIENILNGFYPLDVLRPENPVTHGLRWPKVILDSIQASQRRHQKIHDQFNENSKEYLVDLPEYYKRNFHFQTDGYLGDKSAELYEHQVEILFSGAADAMRRLIIPQIKIHLQSLGYSESGEGVKFLELGSGTGRLSKFVALAFPKAQLTCLDLSPTYLTKSKENLHPFKRINFIQSAAEKTPFKDESFDVIFSCFLFHELPYEIRQDVMKESLRLTKPQGMIAAVDSLQQDDDLDFQWALEQFPIDFHEPFYKNYTLNSLADLWQDVGLKNVQIEKGFLAKSISGVKDSH